MAVLRMPRLRGSFAMGAILATVVMATLVVGPFYLSRALALPAATVGALMSTGPFVAALVGMPGGRLVDRFGSPRIVEAGLYAAALGTLGLAFAGLGLGKWAYVLPLVLITAGYGLFQAANNTAVMTAVAPGQRGLISGLLGLSRNLGLVSGASLMGAVFAFGAGTDDPARATPTAVAAGMHFTYAIATVLVGVAIAIARSVRRADRMAGH
jgi:MFS family permease